MARYLENNFNFWSVLAIVVVIFLVITIITSRLAAFFWPVTEKNQIGKDSLLSLLSVSASGSFILIIFINLNAWNYLQSATTACLKEAAAIIDMINTVQYFDSVGTDKIIKAAQNYAVAVRVDEWATMREGKESPVARAAIQNIFATVREFHPIDSGFNAVFFARLIATAHDINIARQERLQRMHSVVPPELRAAVTLGCFILVMVLGSIWRERTVLKLVPVFVFDILLAFNLVLAFYMDYPFSGISLSADNQMYYSSFLKDIPPHG